MKTLVSLAYGSSAACFGILLSLGPDSPFWEQHRTTSMLLGAGVPMGFVAAFFLEKDLFQTPGTFGHRVSCVVAILVSLAGIGAFLAQFNDPISKGFFVGGIFLLLTVVSFVERRATATISEKRKTIT